MTSLLETDTSRFSFPLAVFCALLACEDVSRAQSLTRPLAAEPARNPRGAYDADHADARRSRVVTFEGACDASGAVELDDHRFLVADDEDNRLRVYDADRGGEPISEIDLSAGLAAAHSRPSEADFEAATRIGDRAYFLASHGRTSKGKPDPNRLMFLSTTLPGKDGTASIVGQPYRSLLEDLVAHPALQRFELGRASLRAPKEPGGFNIEGLTAATDGSVWLGFRNPVPEGRALVVRLLNPRDTLEGERARLSDPALLDLGGLGVRALSSWRGSLLLVAGPSGDGGPFALFRFDGRSRVAPIGGIDLGGFGPEAFFTPESRDEILVLSDDGTRSVGGKACKKLKDSAQKSFRGVWLGITP
jgi:hypothetical protein